MLAGQLRTTSMERGCHAPTLSYGNTGLGWWYIKWEVFKAKTETGNIWVRDIFLWFLWSLVALHSSHAPSAELVRSERENMHKKPGTRERQRPKRSPCCYTMERKTETREEKNGPGGDSSEGSECIWPCGVSQDSSTKVHNWNLVKRLKRALPGNKEFSFSLAGKLRGCRGVDTGDLNWKRMSMLLSKHDFIRIKVIGGSEVCVCVYACIIYVICVHFCVLYMCVVCMIYVCAWVYSVYVFMCVYVVLPRTQCDCRHHSITWDVGPHLLPWDGLSCSPICICVCHDICPSCFS